MRVMPSVVARALFALLLIVAGAATAAAQPTPAIAARTPSRGGNGGGTTVEIIGNSGWFSFSTTVTMSPANAAQPTNVTTHSPTRVTFVTPARLPGACPSNVCTITVTSGVSRQATFTYVARTRTGLASARKPVFSYDGRFVAFESRFALAASDTNGLVDIYVRNRLTGVVRRISISSNGGQALGGESTGAAISASGRFIAFQSRATNLVLGDTNGQADVFLHDRDADGDGIFDESGAVTTERVSFGVVCSTACFPAQALGGGSGDPAISGNGRFIAYQTAATNMPADTNGRTDIFVFDRLRRITRLISRNINGLAADDHSRNPAMSLSGRFVVFESLADDIAGGNPGTAANPISDIFLHDRDFDGNGVFDETGGVDTTLVSSNRCEANLTNHSIEPSITFDGRYVVFATTASNAKVDEFCQPDDRNGARDIFIFDRQLGTVSRRLSEGQGGELPGASGAPVLSGNGNLLLFRTQAVNAAGAATPGRFTAAVTGDGKSTTGQVPSPTTDAPPPADVPPAPPSGSTEGSVDERRRHHDGQHDRARSGHRGRRAGRRDRRDAGRLGRHPVPRRLVARLGAERRR